MNWRKPVIYALLYLTGSKIPKNLKEIKRINKLSNKKLMQYQDEKLKKILLHAHDNVLYYTKILEKSKVVVNGRVNLDNFDKIPILTKEIIRNNFDDLHTKKLGKGWKYNTSGGSTGEPIKLIQDDQYLDWEIANKIWYKIQAGQEIGEKELRFWGSERDLLEGKESLKIRLRNWLYNRKEFNTFKMSEKEMFQYVEKWNEYKPHWVESYVQSIYEFARFIEKNKLNVYSPDNGILTSAGTLYPEMKRTIERVFKCKVYNRYGSREVGDMACGKDKLKLSLWNHKIEVIKDNLIVSLLINFTMPLIRYEIGDIGGMSKNLMYLTKIEGRKNNIIRLKDGRKIDSAAITSALYFDLDGNLLQSFSKYQFVQKKIDEFELNVIINDRILWKKEKKIIRDILIKILGRNIKLNLKEVKEIPASANGKYEYIRSEIK